MVSSLAYIFQRRDVKRIRMGERERVKNQNLTTETFIVFDEFYSIFCRLNMSKLVVVIVAVCRSNSGNI